MRPISRPSVSSWRGAPTTGEVGRKLGLTSGAVTGVIDRLAERGFVKRVDDPRDRRKVVVRPVAARMEPVSELFGPIESALAGLVVCYSQQQIATIAQFLAQAADLVVASAEKLDRGREPQPPMIGMPIGLVPAHSWVS